MITLISIGIGVLLGGLAAWQRIKYNIPYPKYDLRYLAIGIPVEDRRDHV